MKEQKRLDIRCEKVRQHCSGRVLGAIRKHLPRLAMLHWEVDKAVFPLPRDMMKLEIDRQDHQDRVKLTEMLEKIEAKNRKRKREEEQGENGVEFEMEQHIMHHAAHNKCIAHYV